MGLATHPVVLAGGALVALLCLLIGSLRSTGTADGVVRRGSAVMGIEVRRILKQAAHDPPRVTPPATCQPSPGRAQGPMKLDVPLSEGIPYYCVLTQAKLRWRADAVSRRYPIPITAISISAIYLGEFIIRWADEDTYYDGGGFDGKRHVGSFSLIGASVRRVEATVVSGPKIELSAGEGAPPPSVIDMRRIQACACRRY